MTTTNRGSFHSHLDSNGAQAPTYSVSIGHFVFHAAAVVCWANADGHRQVRVNGRLEEPHGEEVTRLRKAKGANQNWASGGQGVIVGNPLVGTPVSKLDRVVVPRP